MPMETWSVSTGTVDFVVRVDKKLRVGSGLFQNCKSLFRPNLTVHEPRTTNCVLTNQIYPIAAINDSNFVDGLRAPNFCRHVGHFRTYGAKCSIDVQC